MALIDSLQEIRKIHFTGQLKLYFAGGTCNIIGGGGFLSNRIIFRRKFAMEHYCLKMGGGGVGQVGGVSARLGGGCRPGFWKGEISYFAVNFSKMTSTPFMLLT